MTRNRKPYDQAFKYLSETDPRALLALLGALDADAPATVTRLPQELIVSAVIADEIFLVEADGHRRIVHIEARTRYDPTLPVRLAQYAIRLHIAYDLPVRTFLLPLTKRGVPEPVPTEGVIEIEGLRLTFGYTERPALLPFVPLMHGDRTELATAANPLAKPPDEARRQELQLHFLVLGGLRYDAATLMAALGDSSMIPPEQLRESSVYQLILQEGKAEGRQEGRQEGREEGLERERALVARQLRRKFGELPEDLVARVRALPREPLERLGEDLLDLAAWLDRAE